MEHMPGFVRQAQSGGYYVASRSQKGYSAFVWGDECSCPATGRCWHLAQVAAFVKAMDATRRRPVAPPAVSLLVD